MKVLFVQACIDKETGKDYKAGDIVSFSDERAKEILKRTELARMVAEELSEESESLTVADKSKKPKKKSLEG